MSGWERYSEMFSTVDPGIVRDVVTNLSGNDEKIVEALLAMSGQNESKPPSVYKAQPQWECGRQGRKDGDSRHRAGFPPQTVQERQPRREDLPNRVPQREPLLQTRTAEEERHRRTDQERNAEKRRMEAEARIAAQKEEEERQILERRKIEEETHAAFQQAVVQKSLEEARALALQQALIQKSLDEAEMARRPVPKEQPKTPTEAKTGLLGGLLGVFWGRKAEPPKEHDDSEADSAKEHVLRGDEEVARADAVRHDVIAPTKSSEPVKAFAELRDQFSKKPEARVTHNSTDDEEKERFERVFSSFAEKEGVRPSPIQVSPQTEVRPKLKFEDTPETKAQFDTVFKSFVEKEGIDPVAAAAVPSSQPQQKQSLVSQSDFDTVLSHFLDRRE